MEFLNSPAAERNKTVIADVLCDALPSRGLVLEIASGTGQHVVYFAETLPHLQFQPSDLSAEARESITARTEQSECKNILPPLAIDCTASVWPDLKPAAIVCINMIHIAPWSACAGLFAWAGKTLAQGQPLILYGPFWRDGLPREPSNVDFDRSLQSRNPEWGIRSLAQVERQAVQSGLHLEKVVPMPANNLSVVFRR